MATDSSPDSSPPPGLLGLDGLSAAARAKVGLLEELINERLKTDLQRVVDERDRVHERIAQWCAAADAALATPN